ncbi:MAG: iron-containing alcohol dehydrogenase, partial [Pseudomonadota bacterium]
GAWGHHHGELNAILLPPILRFNRALIPDKFARMNAAIGLSPDAELADWVENLVETLGLPRRLADLGLTVGQVDEAAERAVSEHLNRTNPRPLNADEFRTLLHSVLI